MPDAILQLRTSRALTCLSSDSSPQARPGSGLSAPAVAFHAGRCRRPRQAARAPVARGAAGRPECTRARSSKPRYRSTRARAPRCRKLPITMHGDRRWRPGRRRLRSPGRPFSTARWRRDEAVGGTVPDRTPAPCLGLGRPRSDRFERNCSCHTFAARVARWTRTPQRATARLTTARAAALLWQALCGGPGSMASWSAGRDGSRSARTANHRRPGHATRADGCGAAGVGWIV
jgi:hypothetical protein